MESTTASLSNMAASPLHKSPSPPLFNGSVTSLKSQMLARAATHTQSQQKLDRQIPQPGGQHTPQSQQPQHRMNQQLDPSILSRMVTASGRGGATSIPIRVASMQEFRRSMSSLNCVPEQTMQPRPVPVRAPNQAFDLNNRRSTLGAGSHRPMPTENPLLKMMEQRMMASKKGVASGGGRPAVRNDQTPSPAASAAALPGPGHGNKAALHASISKWAGIGAVSSYGEEKKCEAVHETAAAVQPILKQSSIGSPQMMSVQAGGGGSPSGSGRVPLSTQQVGLLKELTASQNRSNTGGGTGTPQASQKELLQMLFQYQPTRQTSGQNQSLSTQNAAQPSLGNGLRINVPQSPNITPTTTSSNASLQSLTRCAQSMAEIDRLRRENSSIQLRQQMALQERAMLEQQILQEKAHQEQEAYLQQRNIAVNALVSMQGTPNGSQQSHQQPSLTQEQFEQQLDQMQAIALKASMRKRRPSRPGELDNQSQHNSKGSLTQQSNGLVPTGAYGNPATCNSKWSSSMRKRRSLRPDEDDLQSCSSRGSLTSHTQSIASSTNASNASSAKVHRSLSGTARGSLYGSMENLRIQNSRRSSNGMGIDPTTNSSLRNASFSSDLNNIGGMMQQRRQLSQNSYNSSQALHNQHSMNNHNQSFSSGGSSKSSSLYKPQRRPSTQQVAASLRRSASSSNWVKSMLSQERTAGSAAATFEIALSSNSLVSLSRKPQQSPLPKEPQQQRQEEVKEVVAVSHQPIQVQAEEYSAPPLVRAPSTSSETVIISAVPDRIKYQDAKADTKPIDVVKEALSARGCKCDTTPSIAMSDEFFVKVTEMYDQDVVNAIRSNDVESLKSLHAAGTNLQCGNRFGETLIHLACRRSHRDLVSFLVTEAGVSLHVRDDFGRTPMHDACWRAEPDLELLDLLLDRAPELLMLTDKRGHTPLDYARREHWAVLVPFLLERTDKFKSEFKPV